MIVVNLLAAGT